MNISAKILKMVGWKVQITTPDYPKCIICVAPHTSNWDFILGKLAYWSVNRHAGFLMKEAWFFFPLGYFFRKVGGIPVPKKRGGSLVDTIVNKYNSSEKLSLAITPEGTRSRVIKWRTGFLNIAREANVPILLGVLDYSTKSIYIRDVFKPSGDNEEDMRRIKDYYRPYQGKYPDKFSTEY